MSAPLLCSRCGREVRPGEQVSLLLTEQDELDEAGPPRITLSEDTGVAHLACPPAYKDVHHTLTAPLAVGTLKWMLLGCDDDMQVVVDDGEGWYLNVGEVVVPTGEWDECEYSAVTLFRGAPVDGRQF